MATDKDDQITQTEQNILNKSQDTAFKVLATEMLGYDPTASTLNRVKVNASGELVSEINQALVERIVLNTLKKLNTDSAGRLRVSAESVASHAVTLTTLTNLTNWGLLSATAKSRLESNLQYQSGFRRNLVVTT